FDNGKVPIVKAAKMAAGEVFLPVFSGTLTTLAPFAPLLFWPGIIGKFMFFLPVTLIVTLLASLAVAYIINPVFAVDFMSHDEHAEPKPTFNKKVKKTLLILGGVALLGYLINFGLGNFVVFLALLYILNHFFLTRAVKKFQTKIWPAFQNRYVRLLHWAVEHPKKLIWGTFGLFFLTLFVFVALVGSGRQKIIFFPSADPNFVYVYVGLPVGTDQAYTNEVVQKVERKVTDVLSTNGKIDPVVTSIISNVTKGVTDPQDEDQGEYPNKGKVTVSFIEFGKRDGKNTADYLESIEQCCQVHS
ncbi:MAG: efflux RND transporter permease subunit, partial [Proteobacteria bacterium]